MDSWKPKHESDFIGCFQQIALLKKWISNYPGKAAFVYGKCGTGKTSIVDFVLTSMNCTKIEINTVMLKNSIKSIKEYTKKIFESKDISSYFILKKQSIIVIDELENLLLEKGILSEIITMITTESIISKIPIIIISNTRDKKVGELLKKSFPIEIEQPSFQNMKKLICNIILNSDMNIQQSAINKIIHKSEKDYRRLLNIMNEIYFVFKTNEINDTNITPLLDSIINKNIDINLFDITNKILSQKMDINNIFRLYESDKLLISLMTHENYMKQLCFICKSEDDFVEKIADISHNMSISEMYEKIVYNRHTWELYNYSGLHSCCFPNYVLNKNGNNNTFRKMAFTNYLSKSSTYTSKRKTELYYNDILNIPGFSFMMLSDLIVSSAFSKDNTMILNFLKEKGLKTDDFDKIYKFSSFKDTYKKQFGTKFKKMLKDAIG